MAIRLRKIKSNVTKVGWEWIALCAAEHTSQKDDIYIDDNKHYALYEKFDTDREMEK